MTTTLQVWPRTGGTPVAPPATGQMWPRGNAGTASGGGPVTGTQFALDISVNADPGVTIGQQYINVTTNWGRPLGPHMKFFDGGSGWTAAWNNYLAMGWGHAPGEVEPVYCSKVHNTTQFNTLMTNAPGTAWVVFWHEPEDDIRDGALTVADYRSTYQAMYELRRVHPNKANIKIMANLMGYQERGIPHDPARDVYALCSGLTGSDGGFVFDAIGGDIYHSDFEANPPVFNPDTQINWLPTAAATLGVPWCIPEYGDEISNTPGDTYAKIAERVQAVIDYCRADGNCLWVNYWEDDTYALYGHPGQAVWDAAMG
jgi:hypothetical protein